MCKDDGQKDYGRAFGTRSLGNKNDRRHNQNDTFPDAYVLAQEVVENLEGALEKFREVARFSMAPTLYRSR